MSHDEPVKKMKEKNDKNFLFSCLIGLEEIRINNVNDMNKKT